MGPRAMVLWSARLAGETLHMVWIPVMPEAGGTLPVGDVSALGCRVRHLAMTQCLRPAGGFHRRYFCHPMDWWVRRDPGRSRCVARVRMGIAHVGL